jgi:hypothetical protein
MSNSENLDSQVLDADESDGYIKFDKGNLTGTSTTEMKFNNLRSAPLNNKLVVTNTR